MIVASVPGGAAASVFSAPGDSVASPAAADLAADLVADLALGVAA